MIHLSSVRNLPKQLLSNRRALVGALVIVVLLGVGAAWLLIRNDNKPAEETIQISSAETEEQFYPKEYVKPEKARDLFTVEGEIAKLDGQSLTIKAADGTQDFKTVDDTYYKKGSMFETGEPGGVKIGSKVQVTADRNSKEVYSIWYDY